MLLLVCLWLQHKHRLLQHPLRSACRFTSQVLTTLTALLQVQLGVLGKIKFTLNNDEHLPFTFALDKTSYDASDALLAASGGKALLDIQPAAGTVPANSKVSSCVAWLLPWLLRAGSVTCPAAVRAACRPHEQLHNS